jgi:hypothetical protein
MRSNQDYWMEMGWLCRLRRLANRVVRIAFGERPAPRSPLASFGKSFYHCYHLEIISPTAPFGDSRHCVSLGRNRLLLAPLGEAFLHRHHLKTITTIAVIWWSHCKKQSSWVALLRAFRGRFATVASAGVGNSGAFFTGTELATCPACFSCQW